MNSIVIILEEFFYLAFGVIIGVENPGSRSFGYRVFDCIVSVHVNALFPWYCVCYDVSCHKCKYTK